MSEVGVNTDLKRLKARLETVGNKIQALFDIIDVEDGEASEPVQDLNVIFCNSISTIEKLIESRKSK